MILWVLSFTCLWLGVGLAAAGPPGSVVACVFLVGICVLFAVIGFTSQRRAAGARRRFFAAHASSWRNPASESLDEQWTKASRTPDTVTIRQALALLPPAEPPAAVIVCLGNVEPAEIGEHYFEPEIITPTRSLGYRLIWIPIGLALLALYSVQSLHLIPGLGRPRFGGFGYMAAMAVSTAIAWVWKSAVRPTYVRLAPGMVQIMEFRYRRKKPEIRSYPMDPGTLVVVRGEGRARAVTLSRGETTDEMPLGQMALSEDSRRRFWEALLSTAPTPPLSDEELLG